MQRTHLLTAAAIVGLSLLVAAGPAAAAENAEPDLRDAFARFDRVYVPALALTKMGTADASRKAVARLKAGWQPFEAGWAKAMPDDPEWQADFDRVGRAIDEAAEAVAAGRPADAHETLEKVRDIFREARRRNGIDYYMDHLTDFHATMEEIVTAVGGETPVRLDQAAIAELAELTSKARRQWTAVESAPFNAGRFAFDEKKQAKRRQLLRAENEALTALEAALAGGSTDEIVASGKAIKPIFAQSFMLFGDFPEPPPRPGK